MPSAPAITHDSHSPSQLASQHTPSTQKVLSGHSVSSLPQGNACAGMHSPCAVHSLSLAPFSPQGKPAGACSKAHASSTQAATWQSSVGTGQPSTVQEMLLPPPPCELPVVPPPSPSVGTKSLSPTSASHAAVVPTRARAMARTTWWRRSMTTRLERIDGAFTAKAKVGTYVVRHCARRVAAVSRHARPETHSLLQAQLGELTGFSSQGSAHRIQLTGPAQRDRLTGPSVLPFRQYTG